MTDFKFKETYGLDDLLEIMKILRSPSGCPWDMEQTHKSIKNDFIEEVYEAIEAIDLDDTACFVRNWAMFCCKSFFTARSKKKRIILNSMIYAMNSAKN